LADGVGEAGHRVHPSGSNSRGPAKGAAAHGSTPLDLVVEGQSRGRAQIKTASEEPHAGEERCAQGTCPLGWTLDFFLCHAAAIHWRGLQDLLWTQGPSNFFSLNKC
jgi:hypothetical protein